MSSSLAVLVVCSANRCRSPMASAMLRGRLADAGVDAEVTSAGFGPAGLPPLPEAVRVMADAGHDIAGHRSRAIDAASCRSADLVVGMTRQHVVDVALTEPESWPRAFVLTEVVHRGRQAGGPGPSEGVEGWVRRLHLGRTRSALLALPSSNDIADPVGRPVGDFERTRLLLDRLTAELASLIAPVAT